ncbi:COG1470 family protein [Streptomyces cucumeris]|uniref:COG1470 family protein n=1 Tax=Streptomyces cucumeris TaxID=2962890 RepID=UPI003EC02C70
MPSRTHTVVHLRVRTAALLTAPLLALAVFPTAVATAAPAAPAGHGWSAAPAPGGGRAPGAGDRAYFYLEGGPGAVLRDTLAVTNEGTRPRTVRLRGTGGVRVALAEHRVTVPPRTRADVPLTVTVPADAAPGERTGAVRVSGDGREIAVRTHLRVNGPTMTSLSVEDVRVERHGDGAAIRYALVNRGTTALTPRLAVRADGLFGAVLRRDARTLPLELAPGRRVRLTERWPDAPAADRVAVRLTVTAAGGAQDTASTTYTAVPPWLLVTAALGALGAGTGAGRRLVRRHRRRARDTEAAAPEAEAVVVEAGAGAGAGADG